MRRFTLAAFMLVAAVAAFAVAQDAFSLKRSAKVGDTQKYKIEVKADFGGQMIEFSATSVEKVVKVEADGALHVESSQAEAKVKFGDNEMEVPDQEATTMIYNADGLIREIKGEESDASSYRLAIASLTPTPEKPVKVGDKWTHTYKADSKTGAVAAKAAFEVLATEKWKSFDTLKMKITFEETEGDEKMTAVSTVWLDVKDFTVVRAESELKKAPLPGAPEPVDMTVKLERI